MIMGMVWSQCNSSGKCLLYMTTSVTPLSLDVSLKWVVACLNLVLNLARRNKTVTLGVSVLLFRLPLIDTTAHIFELNLSEFAGVK